MPAGRHTRRLMLAALAVTALACSPGSDRQPSETVAAAPPRDTVTVDSRMAERGIEWLELAASGADDAALRETFFTEVAPTAGCGAIVDHWARFREWDAELFYNFILRALGRVPTDAPLVDETGHPTRLGHARRLWTAALQDPDSLRRDLDALRNADVRDAALARAKGCLPADADVTNDFHVVLFGASTAFSVGGRNGYDLLQLPRTPDGHLDVERVIRTFAHEMHHSGLSNAAERTMGPASNSDRLRLVGILTAEGMATWCTTPPDAYLERYRASDDPTERQIAADWDRHRADLRRLYAAAEDDIRRDLHGELSVDELRHDWLSGMIGPAYAVGTDMCRTIEAELGTETLVDLAHDYRNLLRVYNRAARRANDRGADRPLFDPTLAEAVLHVTGADETR